MLTIMCGGAASTVKRIIRPQHVRMGNASARCRPNRPPPSPRPEPTSKPGRLFRPCHVQVVVNAVGGGEKRPRAKSQAGGGGCSKGSARAGVRVWCCNRQQVVVPAWWGRKSKPNLSVLCGCRPREPGERPAVQINAAVREGRFKTGASGGTCFVRKGRLCRVVRRSSC